MSRLSTGDDPGALVTAGEWSPRPAEPYEPGNVAALKHGAHSSRFWRPIADRLAEELAQVAPWTARPAYAATVAAWARVEAQLHLVADWLDEHGILDDKGRPRPATALQERLEARAEKLRGRLGLDPMGALRLVRAFGAAPGNEPDPDAGLRQLVEDGRRALEGRDQ